MFNVPEQNLGNDPEELRGHSKNQIYKLLSAQYILPDKEARGVTKAYLIQIYRNQVFRVQRNEIMEYEAHLRLEDNLKSAFASLPLSVTKLNIHLRLLGHLETGFSALVYPDEVWLSRVIRFTDPYNVIGYFKSRILNAPLPDSIAGRM